MILYRRRDNATNYVLMTTYEMIPWLKNLFSVYPNRHWIIIDSGAINRYVWNVWIDSFFLCVKGNKKNKKKKKISFLLYFRSKWENINIYERQHLITRNIFLGDLSVNFLLVVLCNAYRLEFRNQLTIILCTYMYRESIHTRPQINSRIN